MSRSTIILKTAAGAIALAAAGPALAAATTIFTAGNGYSESFNALAASGTASSVPAGFRFQEIGTNANASYAAGTGSANAGDTYSFGAAGAAERAFGGLQSGSLTPTLFGEFVNGSGRVITALTIGYTGEQWRFGGTASGRGSLADRLDFAYALAGGTFTDLDTLDFTSRVTSGAARALDGNLASNRQALSVTLDNLSLAAGAAFAFRWSDFNVTGADDGLAVDDFTLTATFAPIVTPPPVGGAVPEPATWGMMALGFGLVGAAARRRRGPAHVAA